MDRKVMDTNQKRLTYSFRRAARAMAITSSTTAVAFFANGLSSMIAISSFGIFAGIIVPVNYMLVIFIFPPAVVWYEEHIIAKKTDGDGNELRDAEGNVQYVCPNCICFGRCMPAMKKMMGCGVGDEYDESGKKIAKLGFTERIFDTHINNFVGHKIGKWVILFISLAWFGAAIGMTTQIEPLTK